MTSFSKEFFDLPSEEKLRFDMSGGKKGGFIVSSHLQVTKFSSLYTIILHCLFSSFNCPILV